MGDATQSPIASKAQECVGLFEALAELSSSWDDSPAHGIEQREVLEHLGQFRIWAGNIGALQPRSVPSSLEHRLRDAPKFAAEVMSLLGDLVDILEDGTRTGFSSSFTGHSSACNADFGWNIVFAIASGEREGRVDDSDSSISDSSTAAAAAAAADGSSSATTVEQHGTLVGEELEELSEIQELLRSIPEMISMLFKLSVIIRSSSSRDRFAKAQMVSSRAAVDPSYDIGYVKDKFPTLKSEGMDWLATRLGTAIAQRRQFMWYCRDHRDKMAKADADDARGSRSRGAREADVDRILNIRSNRENAASLEVKSQFSKPASTQAPTTASTVIPGKLDSEVLLDTLKVDSSDADSQSVTSYASSVGESDEAPVLSVIPLEDVAAPRANFECPYCWTIQKFNNQKAWK